MIDFRVFKNRNYILCTSINFILGTTLFGGSFLFSLYCGTVMNYTPLNIGILFLKGCFIQLLIMPLIGKIVNIIDKRLLIGVGIILVFISLWYNSHLNHFSSQFDLVFVLFARSIGLSFLFVPLSVTAISFVEPKGIGNAIGLFNLTRELGGSIGLAWMSTKLVNHIKEYNNILNTHVIEGSSQLNYQLKMMEHMIYGKVDNTYKAAEQMLQNRVSLQATIESFNKGFLTLALVFLLSIIILILIQNPKKRVISSEGFH
jgi:DHA2 family multidrug resistance protein